MEDILVVDDDTAMLEVITRILEREGIVAHCVSSGEEALEKIRARSFSLMITDFNMPGVDGLELSRESLKMAPEMPIIMDTGGISANITRQAMEIGISRVMSKPFHPKEMVQTIKDVMGKRRERASTASVASREVLENRNRYVSGH